MAVEFNYIMEKVTGPWRGHSRAGCQRWREQIEQISETVEATGSWFEARGIVEVIFNILEE